MAMELCNYSVTAISFQLAERLYRSVYF